MAMMNPEDEVLLDLRPSCTRDEAVAKLLGWMQGPIRKRVIELSEDGISADQLPTLYSLNGSLEQQLLDLREAARAALLAEAEKYLQDADDAAMGRREAAVKDCDDLIRRAAMYSQDIASELARDAASNLAIDTAETVRAGEPCITLVSLDRWARKKYGIAVLPQEEATRSTDLVAAHTLDKEDDQLSTHGLSKLKAHNLYVTLACLVEAFADAKGGKYKKGDKGNVSTIAEHLESVAGKLAGGRQVQGQGKEAIRKRLAAARAALTEALK
jgi:hypothetical protein